MLKNVRQFCFVALTFFCKITRLLAIFAKNCEELLHGKTTYFFPAKNSGALDFFFFFTYRKLNTILDFLLFFFLTLNVLSAVVLSC